MSLILQVKVMGKGGPGYAIIACGLQIFYLTYAPGKSGKGNELFPFGVKEMET